MAFMIGLISRRSAAVGLISHRAAAFGCSSWISQKTAIATVSPPNHLGGFGARRVSTSISEEKSLSSKISSSSPWLMLPPEFEEVGGNKNMIYKFYSLEENKLVSLNKKKKGEGEEEDLMVGPDDDAKLLGSSHGWLALINQRNNNDMFLFNPLSGCHIKLPPANTLPIPTYDRLRHVGKLIISCSPTDDEESCRALINLNSSHKHAFCCPGRSSEWTPLEVFHGDFIRDFVYSSRQKLFFGVTTREQFVALDLQDPRSPRVIPMDDVSLDKENFPWPDVEFSDLKPIMTIRKNFLVVAEHSDELFVVRRFIIRRIGPDGSVVEDIYLGKGRFDRSVPYKTIGFEVHKYDSKERAFKYMDSTLDGFSLFIGKNHGFALRATDQFPNELIKPNSIYFTDLDKLINYYESCDSTHGGHDLGIFNYENKTFSPCYYPCDIQNIKRIVPPPMWFTPTHQP